ncbi:uncharacterized protein LOC114806543 isoform X2 [Ornithorhynchus anatinus]|nr:uncharacterized protein LOC114806543 isoform X2 [Ornithorhynchus anatinus]
MEPSREDTNDSSSSSVPTVFHRDEGRLFRDAEDTINSEGLQEIADTEHLSISEIQALLTLVNLSNSCPRMGGNQGNTYGNSAQVAQEEAASTSSADASNFSIDASSLGAGEPAYLRSNEVVQPPLPHVWHRSRRQLRYSSLNTSISSPTSTYSSRAVNGNIRGSQPEMPSRPTQRVYYARGARRRLSWN